MKFKRTMEYKVGFLGNKQSRKEREAFLSKKGSMSIVGTGFFNSAP